MLTSVLKPGLLVSLKTNVRGGVEYQRRELEQEHTEGNGSTVAKWETTRVILDPVEYERAIQARGKARTAVISACNQTSFGLLCPMAREAELNTAIDVARIIADEFNATALRSTVEVYVITGRVAQDDVEAARAIGAEIRDLLEAMESGIKAMDAEAIREAANKARAIGGMLTESANEKMQSAIKEARAAARVIVKRIEKGAEDSAKVVAEISIKEIEAARFAFIDLDPVSPVAPEPVAPASPDVGLQPAELDVAETGKE
jgi:hypothetical protein